MKGFVITAKRHVIAKWCPVLRGCCSSLGSEACPKRRAHWSGSAKHAAAQDRAGNRRHGLPFVVRSIGGLLFSDYLCSMLMSHVSGFQHLDEPGRTLCSNSQRPRADMYIPALHNYVDRESPLFAICRTAAFGSGSVLRALSRL